MIQQYIISNADELLKALSLTLLTFKFKLADCTQIDSSSTVTFLFGKNALPFIRFRLLSLLSPKIDYLQKAEA